jgi:protein-S-isoprenylcysteine O-methyltransferase
VILLITPRRWFPSPAFGRLFTLAVFGWYAIELLNIWIDRRTRGGRRAEEDGSYWAIVATFYLSLVVGYAARFLKWGLLPEAVQYLGISLMLLGIGLREWAIIVLGRHFSLVVQIAVGHRLVTRGPYRWLRHPAYTGSLLTAISLSLALGTWVGAVLTVVAGMLAYSYRMHIEERALIAAFGDLYRDYMRRTWRYLPGW